MKVRVGHASLQFADSNKNHESDIKKIFARARGRRWAWITGTEAGSGSGNTGEVLLKVGKDTGYRLWVPEEQAEGGHASHSDAWIAVRKDLIDGGWNEGFDFAIPSSKVLYSKRGLKPDLNPRWGAKGLVRVGFHNDLLGDVNLGAAHYLHKSRNLQNADDHGVDRGEWNGKLADVIGKWAQKVAGDEKGLAFYGGDQNMADDRKGRDGDTFFGNPMTSAWDEVNHYENTGHGTIDVIASFDGDGRVKAASASAFSDKEFRLHMDHFLIEAVFNIDPVTLKE